MESPAQKTKIIVNGEEIRIPKKSKVQDLLMQYQLDPAVTIVEVNSIILKKEEYGSVFFREMDKVELIRFMGGGGS
jgi:sulfur carrier protein